MAFYAFVTEPPLPRTEFEFPDEETAGAPSDYSNSVYERAAVNVLMGFPEAYRAVLDEMSRLRERGGYRGG